MRLGCDTARFASTCPLVPALDGVQRVLVVRNLGDPQTTDILRMRSTPTRDLPRNRGSLSHRRGPVVFAVVVVGLVALMGVAAAGYSLQAPTFPSGIIAYVPITISNRQSSPTPAPFQQMVQVDSAAYSPYEATNLQNVEFFTSTGSLIPSWLESGASSSSTDTIYWLKIAGGIAAEFSLTVYMAFASPTTNLLNAQTTGEAPALSPSYGEYDDGRSVFSYEWNFAGTSLPAGWSFSSVTSEGGYSVSNGASFFTGSCGQQIPQCANTVYGYYQMPLNAGSYLISTDMTSYAAGNNGQGVWFGWWSQPQSPTTAGAESDIRPYNGNHVSDFIWCPDFNCAQPFEVTSKGGSTQTANCYDAAQHMVYSLGWLGDNQVGTLAPPSGAPITVSQASSSPSGGSYYLGFWDFTKGTGNNGETAQWVTVGAIPPNGVMPLASAGISLVYSGPQGLVLYLTVAIVVVIAVGLVGFLLFGRENSGQFGPTESRQLDPGSLTSRSRRGPTS